jgi:hypothetical protein
MPSLVIQKPKYSVSVWPKNDLAALTLRPACASHDSTCSSLFK